MLIVLCLLGIAISDKTKPGLFNKEPEASKMVIKNNIGYHFKRLIRDVNREMFISRRINLVSVFNGIRTLKQTRDGMQKYCKAFPAALQKAAANTVSPTLGVATDTSMSKPRYIWYNAPNTTTYHEAKAKCIAEGRQLPEVYTADDASQLTTFMKRLGIDECHAGIEPDIISGILRFVSTGLPIWKSYLKPLLSGGVIDYLRIIDDAAVRLFYTKNGTMAVKYDRGGPAAHQMIGVHSFWEKNDKIYTEYRAHIVCEQKWDGSNKKLVPLSADKIFAHISTGKYKRSAASDFNTSLDLGGNTPSQLTFEAIQMDPGTFQTPIPEADISSPRAEVNGSETSLDLGGNTPSQSTFEAIQMDPGTFQTPIPEADVSSPRAEIDGSEIQQKDISKRAVVGSQSSLATTIELCDSVTAQINETYQKHRKNTEQLLSQVDISVHYNDELNDQPVADTDLHQEQSQERPKRNPIAKFFFKLGVGILSSLFGFVKDIDTQRRISKLERTLDASRLNISKNSDDIRKNEKAIQEVTQLISDHAFAIDKLQLVTDGLDHRLTEVEANVNLLNTQVQYLSDHVQVMATIELIENLVIRIDQSLSSGHDVLESITHCALMGQTSPLILPVDQVKLVQEDLYKVSSAVLDPNFSRMNSIVLSDPKDNSYLLVVVNAAAVSRTNLELVEMTAIPSYGSSHAYIPILDHQVVALDQYSATFSVLSKQEYDGCLDGRCYISNMAQPVTSTSCGMPQYFDRHLEVCEREIITSDGMFLEPAMPDGYFYSFKDEVMAQLFCKGRRTLTSSSKVKGIGVLQLPTGCELSVTNPKGHNIKVKGQPKIHLTNAGDMEISSSDLYSEQQDPPPVNDSFKLPQDAAMEQHLLHVQQAVASANERMSAQSTLLIIIIGSVGAVVTLIAISVVILYCNSRRFRKKFKSIGVAVHDLGNRVNQDQERDYIPLVPPRPEPVDPIHRIRSLANPSAPRWGRHSRHPSLAAESARIAVEAAMVASGEYVRPEGLDLEAQNGKVERIYTNPPFGSPKARSPQLYPRVPCSDKVKRMATFGSESGEPDQREFNPTELTESLSRLASAGSLDQPKNKVDFKDETDYS